MNSRINRPRLVTALALAMSLSISGTASSAGELSSAELQQISFRVVKNANGWFRVLKSGAMAAMTIHDVHSLGLDAQAAMGEFSRTVAVDTKNDTVQLVSDVGTLGSFVATEVAAPILSTGYEFTSSTLLPAAGSAASSAYSFTKDTALPVAGELAAAGGSAIANGAGALWKWATD